MTELERACSEVRNNNIDGRTLEGVLRRLSLDQSCYEEEFGDTGLGWAWWCRFDFSDDEAKILASYGFAIDKYSLDNGHYDVALRMDVYGFSYAHCGSDYDYHKKEWDEFQARFCPECEADIVGNDPHSPECAIGKEVDGMSLPPLTDWQALNVARNALHAIVHAGTTDDLQMMVARAGEANSDIRQAVAILDRIQSTTPRGGYGDRAYDFDLNGDCRRCGYHASSQHEFLQGGVKCLQPRNQPSP